MNKLRNFPLAAAEAVKPLPNIEFEEGPTMPTPSLDMKQFIGQKFSKLTVESDAGRDDKNNRQVKVLCDCGNSKLVRLSNLRAGNVKTCGRACGLKPGNANNKKSAPTDTTVRPLRAHSLSKPAPRATLVATAPAAVAQVPARLDTAPLEMPTAPPPKAHSNGHHLHRISDQIEGLTMIVLCISPDDLRQMAEELSRLEETLPSFLDKRGEISQMRLLVEKWAEFRRGLEVL
jgi:hypothetical protein